MYHEYPNGRKQHLNGIRLGKAHRLSAWELAEMQRQDDDSRRWEQRAVAAMKRMSLDLDVDDGLFNDFNDRYNLAAHKLTWRQIFYTWRVAHLTVRLQPAISLVDLVRESGLA